MEALTMMGEVQFGRMWLKMIRSLEAPIDLAASTKDSSLKERVFPCTNLT
jgi:hypothetical protein